jgi:hypothetical protein
MIISDPVSDVAPQTILDTPMQHNDARAETIGAYLVALAREVWRENEGFSGKRPFGNSDWEHEVYIALAAAGHIELEDDGYGGHTISDEQELIADGLIYAALDKLASPADPVSGQATTPAAATFKPALAQRQPLYQHACGQVQPYDGEDDGDVMDDCDGCALPDPWRPLYVATDTDWSVA